MPPSTLSAAGLARTVGGHCLGEIEGLVCDRLERRPGEVCHGRVERQSENRAARVRVPIGRAEADEGRDHIDAVVIGHLSGQTSVSAALAITPIPSRSHLTAAPATKIDPSSA